MKKKKLKFAIKQAMAEYYTKGLTCTADRVREKILKAIDKAYSKS